MDRDREKPGSFKVRTVQPMKMPPQTQPDIVLYASDGRQHREERAQIEGQRPVKTAGKKNFTREVIGSAECGSGRTMAGAHHPYDRDRHIRGPSGGSIS